MTNNYSYISQTISSLVNLYPINSLLFIDMEFGKVKVSINSRNKIKQFNDNFLLKVACIDINQKSDINIHSDFIQPKIKKCLDFKMEQSIIELLRFDENDVRLLGIPFIKFYKKIKKIYIPNQYKLIVWGTEDIRMWRLYCKHFRLNDFILHTDIINIQNIFTNTYNINPGRMLSLKDSTSYLNIFYSKKLQLHDPVVDSFLSLLVYFHIMMDKKSLKSIL